MKAIDRRSFVKLSAATGVGLIGWGAVGTLAAQEKGEKLNLGVMGVNGRGTDLARQFAGRPGARIKYICDVDEKAIASCSAAVEKVQKERPEGMGDFRRILDDKSVDALVIAAPDHWHGPATILACAAGKHVYVEKPVCHNPYEGELMVQAARKHNRVVQAGTQRRTYSKVQEGIQLIKDGGIGAVHFARGWYTNNRPITGKRTPAMTPAGLNWDLWQGPAPRREFCENVVHYKWHWYWHWGTGEIGNNGIHALDICRWGLGVDYPNRISSGGGRYFFKDDQETPDTQVVNWDFGDKLLTWEGRSCQPYGVEKSSFGVAFYGTTATMIIDANNYRLLDAKGKVIKEESASAPDAPHLDNFIECVKSGKRPNADIEEGYKSTLLCHLGNIAHRVGRTVNFDSETGTIRDDEVAQKLWRREYQAGWEPKV